MNHLKWMGHSLTIYEIQKNLRNDLQSCEVTLVAKGHSVRAHRFVLSSCSDLLRNVLADVPMGQDATIVIPDIRGSLLDSVLAFIYIGETSISSTNLSEFLESINILGIKSAISFECNTATLTAGPITANLSVKTMGGIQISQEQLIEEDNMETQKTQNILAEQQSSRDLEFLDVYNEPEHKITYSIEHMPTNSNTNEFILTESSGTFTLTQNTKLETSSNSESGKIEEIEDDDEDHIMEEFSSGTDPIIEIAGNTGTSTESSCTPIIQLNSKLNIIKVNPSSPTAELQEAVKTTLETLGDPISVVSTSTESFSPINESRTYDGALEAAVQAVINEGMSLQKAAVKYELSKTVLWRRVRKHPNYMKTARENPLLSLAYERLKNGDSLKNISRELDIPMSTLHRHKVRLVQQGRLPDYVTFKKRDSSSKDELKEKLAKAVHACVHEGMSQNHAANLFDIPKSTLWRHLQKRVAEAELSQRMESNNIKEEVILS